MFWVGVEVGVGVGRWTEILSGLFSETISVVWTRTEETPDLSSATDSLCLQQIPSLLRVSAS